MILSFVNIRNVPGVVLKTEGFATSLRTLQGFNSVWNIMFDPFIGRVTSLSNI